LNSRAKNIKAIFRPAIQFLSPPKTFPISSWLCILRINHFFLIFRHLLAANIFLSLGVKKKAIKILKGYVYCNRKCGDYMQEQAYKCKGD
jgi:hypothetical protein